MDCKKIESQLLDNFYKELSTEKSALVQRHLEQCGHCRVLYNKMSGVLDSIALSADTKPNDFIATRILSKLEHKQTSSTKIKVVQYFLRPAMVISLIVLGIFTGIKISNGFAENQTNTILAVDSKTELTTQFASENYLTSRNDQVIEMYLNDKK